MIRLVNVPIGTNGVSIDFLMSLSEALGSVSSFTQISSLFESAMAHFNMKEQGETIIE